MGAEMYVFRMDYWILFNFDYFTEGWIQMLI